MEVADKLLGCGVKVLMYQCQQAETRKQNKSALRSLKKRNDAKPLS